jgi:hypothetical protein
MGACSADENNSTNSSASRGAGGSSDGGAGGKPTGSGGDGDGGGFNPTGGMNDGGLDPDAACAAQSAEATLVKKPVDIIFVIDNSGSMGDDIIAVQNNINDNFASIIGASGVDYRVIMISTHGEAIGPESICVKAPLSMTDCNPVPPAPMLNPPIFYHYSIEIGSHDAFCRVLGTYDGTTPDTFGLAPNGWKDWVRADAVKYFVMITDDGATCLSGGTNYDDNDNINDGTTTAAKFDAALLALDPLQFGDANKRNYVWHSIIGLAEKATPTEAYQPAEPITAQKCLVNGAAQPGPGTAYQALSITTGGLRFPICQNQAFDVVFQELAKGVIEGAQVACEFPVPAPPAGQTLDLATVQVEYTPGGMGTPVLYKQASSVAMCAPDMFYIENNLIKLCPDACAVVQADAAAKMVIVYGCESKVD